MAFIDGNDVIQQVTAATADPAFRDAILPGAFEGSLHRIYPHLAEHGPIQSEPGLMPPNNSIRQDDDERLLPLRPEAERQHPKQLIEWPQSWPGMFAFQDGKLLSESEVF